MRRNGSNVTYEPGDYVTVTPIDDDPWILHMQRQARVHAYRDDGYMVELEGTFEDPTADHKTPMIRGPIPAQRLMPGWVEQDGRMRVDVLGRRA